MSENFSSVEGDAYLQRMKSARKGPAVLKSDLVKIRSALPTTPILAFEGNDDKVVYHNWINRIRPDFQYEPFPCGGKTYVLQLKQVVERDLSGLGEGVYFFIDRDFDDLRGHAITKKIFMTDYYSVENYLVSERVLDEILKIEFHCHGTVDCRNSVCRLFENVYSEFLNITRETNYRLFLSRRLKIDINLTEKISQLATVSIERTAPGNLQANSLVKYSREPSSDELSQHEAEFAELDPRKRYRGKFSFLFFKKWLEQLAEDRNASVPRFFPKLEDGSKANYHSLNLASFASKSDIPAGLADFIKNISINERK